MAALLGRPALGLCPQETASVYTGTVGQCQEPGPHYPAQPLLEETRALCAPCPRQSPEPHVNQGTGMGAGPLHTADPLSLSALLRWATWWQVAGMHSPCSSGPQKALGDQLTVPAAIPVQEPVGHSSYSEDSHHGVRSAPWRPLHVSTAGECCNPKFSRRPDNLTSTQLLDSDKGLQCKLCWEKKVSCPGIQGE